MCPTLIVGSFLDAYGPLLCSFVQQLELRRFKTLEPQKPVQNEKKKQNRRPEPRKHTKDAPFDHFGVFHLDFFRDYETFFENFWIAPKGAPFICFDILQQNGC